MKNKTIILLIGLLFISAGLIGYFLLEKIPVQNKTELKNPAETSQKTQVNSKQPQIKDKAAIKTNLYTNSPFTLPFLSITEIANLSDSIKPHINKIINSAQGVYLLKQNLGTKQIIIIPQAPTDESMDFYPRHNLQIIKVSPEGHISYNHLGYNGVNNEIENAIISSKNEDWVFDKSTEPYRPLKHTIYDNKKHVLFSESWNYDETDPIKYELKNGAGNIISIKKETLEGDTGFRQEHIFYDEDGNIEKTVIITYEGADIKWFTYYDSESPEDNITIESIYEDGLKTEEKIYNQEYKLIETIKAKYTNGILAELAIYDNSDNEILRLENNE